MSFPAIAQLSNMNSSAAGPKVTNRFFLSGHKSEFFSA